MKKELWISEETITVTMPLADWIKIEDRLLWLECLEEAGVDNWGGIEFAQEAYSNATQTEN